MRGTGPPPRGTGRAPGPDYTGAAMDLPVDPVQMSSEEILAVLLAGQRAAAASGPEAAAAYLQRTIQDTFDLPHAVLMVAYELLSEAQAEFLDWDGCTASLARAQQERRLALAEPQPRARPAGTETGAPAGAPAFPTARVAATRPAAVATAEAAAPPAVKTATPEPGAGRQAVEKLCCKCGKDVTHRSRRKDPLTRTYLCAECFGGRHGAHGRSRRGRAALWIALIPLLALLVLGMIILGIGGRS